MPEYHNKTYRLGINDKAINIGFGMALFIRPLPFWLKFLKGELDGERVKIPKKLKELLEPFGIKKFLHR